MLSWFHEIYTKVPFYEFCFKVTTNGLISKYPILGIAKKDF